MEKIGSTITAAVLFFGFIIIGLWFWNGKSLTPAPSFGNSYVEVVLRSNEVFYGKIKHLNTPYPVLTETAYVVLVQTVQAKEVPEEATTAPIQPNRQLVKRGGEPEGPGDEVVLNKDQIVRITELRPDSQVVQIMENWKAGQ